MEVQGSGLRDWVVRRFLHTGVVGRAGNLRRVCQMILEGSVEDS